jgi:hypothetical protein
MISLCHPYGVEITCLCDEAASVLRCFIAIEDGDRDNSMQEDMLNSASDQGQGTSRHCNKIMDKKTEIMMAGTLIMLVIVLLVM